MSARRQAIRGVLFDLDGTLLDTAPDMAGALNALRVERHLAPLPYTSIRPYVSHGGSALVRLAFGETEPDLHAEHLARFLVLYRERLTRETRLFDEMEVVLTRIEARGLPWGVVTNKPAWLTEPLLEDLGLYARARVIVSGDTLPERKPSPAPLLHAAAKLDVVACECIYLGDAERDMQAARDAGMLALGARFGYIAADSATHEWPAEGWIKSPLGLLDWIET